jgi:ankyrin repeat protein
VKKALDDLPATLDDTYTRVLLDIEDMYHDHALTLLRWLAYARSPPTLSELVEAVVTDPTHESSIDPNNRGDLEDTLNILSGLVTLEGSKDSDLEGNSETKAFTSDASTMYHDQADVASQSPNLTPDTRVRLAHFSVKEYLESRRILKSHADRFYLESAAGHRALSQSCLTYLRYYSESSDKSSTRSDFKTFPLLEYAAQSWFYHSALQQSGGIDRELSLLRQEEKKKDWLLVHDPDKPWHVPFRRPEFSGSAVYYASLLGLQSVVEYLLDSGEQVNTQGGYHGNALQAASSRGHSGVMQLLLDKGARVDARAGEYGHALHAATLGSHTKAMELLLDSGADVNAQGGYYGNALQAASFGGRAWAVHLLLDKGADVNAQGGYYGNALQAASSGGHLEVMQLLLDNGAHVNAQGGEYGNALYAVSEGGHTKAIQLLLDCGADVNAQGGYHGNALQAASSAGHIQAMQLLLDSGADVNVQGGYYGNALQAASFGGRAWVVHLLLDKGADVNAQGGYYGNALQAASSGGHLEVMQLLLDHGARINAQGGYYGNALQAASSGGHLGAMQLLLDNGVGVNVQGGEYSNALQAASSRGHIEAMQLLLDRDAEINAQGGEYGNSLYAASEGGYKKAVDLLLEKGADVNAQGGRYGNSLQAASVRGDAEVTQLLLDKGANPNASGGSYSKALHAASSQNFPKISLLLLHYGADVDARSESFETPLQAACVTGATEMAKLLLDSGANPNAVPGSHGTSLRAAALSGSEEIVLQLLSQGADPNPEIPQNDAIFVASRAGFERIVRSLLDYGVPPNSSFSRGSALKMAKKEGHSEVVDLLVLAGAVDSTRVLGRPRRIEVNSPDIKQLTERQIFGSGSDDDSDMRTQAESVFSRQQFSVTSRPTTVSTTLHNLGIQRTSPPDIQEPRVREDSSSQRQPLRKGRTVFQHTPLATLSNAGNLSDTEGAIEIPKDAASVREKLTDDNTDHLAPQLQLPRTYKADEHMLKAADILEYRGNVATYGAVSTTGKFPGVEKHHDNDADLENWALPGNSNSVDSGDSSDGEAVCSDGAHLNVRDEDPERQSQRVVSWCSIVRGSARLHQTAIRWCRPKLRSGYSRLEWSCCCGQHFWGDFEHTEQEHLDHLILGFYQNGFKVKVTTTSGATSTHSNDAHQQDITLASRPSPSDPNKTISAADAQAPGLKDPSVVVSQSAKTSFLDAGKPVYLELCVNRSSNTTRLGEIMLVPGRGEALIKNDQQLFGKCLTWRKNLRYSPFSTNLQPLTG